VQRGAGAHHSRMSSAPKYKKRTHSLAELVPGAMGEALAAQGFAGSEILLRWADIAGPELAAHCEPVRLAWPRGGKEKGRDREPATLHVQVESAFSLELQMQTPVIMERINRYFGWRCVGAIKPKQGPASRRKTAPQPEFLLPPEEEERISEATSGVEDGRLADALQRLGRAIAASRRR
jgi:hypothetical protein